ncbi:hypothetical protein ACL00T_02005 [Curtobacterium flaccumfaciens]|nr:hypothetical protein N8D75_04500 [Curtobacterium flaccumfaciens]
MAKTTVCALVSPPSWTARPKLVAPVVVMLMPAARAGTLLAGTGVLRPRTRPTASPSETDNPSSSSVAWSVIEPPPSRSVTDAQYHWSVSGNVPVGAAVKSSAESVQVTMAEAAVFVTRAVETVGTRAAETPSTVAPTAAAVMRERSTVWRSIRSVDRVHPLRRPPC